MTGAHNGRGGLFTASLLDFEKLHRRAEHARFRRYGDSLPKPQQSEVAAAQAMTAWLLGGLACH